MQDELRSIKSRVDHATKVFSSDPQEFELSSESLIQNLLPTIPSKPGVYRMQDAQGNLLYVGKAKNLNKRLRSYQRPTTVRLQRLMSEVTTLRWDITATELEALHVEMQLIRASKPKYNIIFQHGGPIPALCLSHHPYPRLFVTRQLDPEVDRLLVPVLPGPFLERFSVILTQLFQLRSCSDTVFKRRQQPCLYYTLKRCSAPCVNLISPEAYEKSVQAAYAFVQGRHHTLKTEWHKAMKEASKQRDYESALILRNRCQSLDELERYGHHHFNLLEEGDVCAVAMNAGYASVQLWSFRSGNLVGVENYLMQGDKFLQADTPESILAAFLSSWYEVSSDIPKILLLSHTFKENQFLHEIAQTRGMKCHIQVPQKGPKRHLVNKVLTQAQEALRGYIHDDPAQLMRQLATCMGLKELKKVEIYDTSHLCGTFPKGAKVVFGQKGWVKREFRLYGFNTLKITENMKSLENDLYLMEVMLLRRLGTPVPGYPDLLIVDGGETQLMVAEKVCAIHGLTIPLLCVTKGPHRKNETFILTHNGKRRTVVFQEIVFHFLQRLRDEAHRFGQTHHRRHRESSVYDWFKDIPGLGSVNRSKLDAFLAKQKIPSSAQELKIACGLSQSMAKKIYENLISLPKK